MKAGRDLKVKKGLVRTGGGSERIAEGNTTRVHYIYYMIYIEIVT